PAVAQTGNHASEKERIGLDQKRAERLGRELGMCDGDDLSAEGIARQAQEGQFDLIIMPVPSEPLPRQTSRLDSRALYLLDKAHCRVFLAASPLIPQETDK